MCKHHLDERRLHISHLFFPVPPVNFSYFSSSSKDEGCIFRICSSQFPQLISVTLVPAQRTKVAYFAFVLPSSPSYVLSVTLVPPSSENEGGIFLICSSRFPQLQYFLPHA